MTGESRNQRGKLLAVGKEYKVMFWPAPGLQERTFDDDGFSPTGTDLGGRFDDSFVPAPFFFFFFFFLVEISSHTPISLGQDQSTVAQQAKTTVAKCSLQVVCELISLIDHRTMPGQHSQLTLTLLGQGCMHV